MRALWAIAVKDIRLLLRDRSGAFFTFVFPLIVAVFFGSIFAKGGTPGLIEIVVVDRDMTQGSAAFIKQLRDGGDFAVSTMDERRSEKQKSLARAFADKNEEQHAAMEAVRSGDAAACLVITPGFGAARAAPFAGDAMKVELAIDPSRKATAGMLQGLLTKYGFQQLQASFTNPSLMREQTRTSLEKLRADSTLSQGRKDEFESFFGKLDAMISAIPADEQKGADSGAASGASPGAANGFQPLKITTVPIVNVERGPQNMYAITFPQGVLWGIMGCTLGFALSMVMERTRGTLVRLRSAPLAAWQILGGKGLACFIVTMGVSLVLLLIGIGVFKIRPTSYLEVLAGVMASSFCFVGIMMLLASFTKSERGGTGLGWGVLMLCSMVGGGMIPLEFLPSWLLPVSSLSPVKWSIYSIEGGLWRGLAWSQLAVPLAILTGIGAVGLLVGFRVMGDAERA